MFVRPGVVDEPLSLLETLSACWARQGLGVTIAACFWSLLRKGVFVRFTADVFFFFFFFGRERYSLHKCNDNNLKEM